MLMARRTLGLNLNYARVSLSDTEVIAPCAASAFCDMGFIARSRGEVVAHLSYGSFRIVCVRFAFYAARGISPEMLRPGPTALSSLSCSTQSSSLMYD